MRKYETTSIELKIIKLAIEYFKMGSISFFSILLRLRYVSIRIILWTYNVCFHVRTHPLNFFTCRIHYFFIFFTLKNLWKLVLFKSLGVIYKPSFVHILWNLKNVNDRAKEVLTYLYPPVRMYEDNGEIVIEADMPGFDKKDINISTLS